jgi:hypothetical protein
MHGWIRSGGARGWKEDKLCGGMDANGKGKEPRLCSPYDL